jgi:ABC-type microcin C transport system duplicated ATPase subunit YejF
MAIITNSQNKTIVKAIREVMNIVFQAPFNAVLHRINIIRSINMEFNIELFKKLIKKSKTAEIIIPDKSDNKLLILGWKNTLVNL